MIPLPETYGTEILRIVVGSNLFGTSLGVGQEDRDEMGVFIEHPESTIGLLNREHFTTRTAINDGPSQPGDTDLVVYSLRKWVGLVLHGQPNMMLPLFAPEDKMVVGSAYGDELRGRRDWFASRRVGESFLRYMERQRQRLTGDRGRAGRLRSRGECPLCGGNGIVPEAIVKISTPTPETPAKCPECGGSGLLADWKYAMHMLRLGHQGVEYLKTGSLQLPLPEPLAGHLRAIRKGEWEISEVLSEAEDLILDLDDLIGGKSPLPDEPDVESVQEWMIDATLGLWDHLTSLNCGIDHDLYCCRSHDSHTMPHKGCLLR